MKLRRSRLTHRQSERLLEHFVAGTPARPAAELAKVNRNTARLFYHRLREIIARQLAEASPLAGEVAIGETGAGSVPLREQGDTAASRTPVFGLLKRGNKVYTVMPPDKHNETSLPALKTKLRPDSVVYCDNLDVDGVLHVLCLHHRRIRDRERLARGRAPFNSVENFWGQAKRQLHRYGGIPRQHFHLFLKECEWRFNHGSPRNLLKTLKHWIKTDSH